MGVVSSVARQPDRQSMVYIQTDRPLNPGKGNSGGNHVGHRWQLVGMKHTLILSQGVAAARGWALPFPRDRQFRLSQNLRSLARAASVERRDAPGASPQHWRRVWSGEKWGAIIARYRSGRIGRRCRSHLQKDVVLAIDDRLNVCDMSPDTIHGRTFTSITRPGLENRHPRGTSQMSFKLAREVYTRS